MSSIHPRLIAVAILLVSPAVMLVQVTAGLVRSFFAFDLEGGWDRFLDDMRRWRRTYRRYFDLALGREV